MQKCKVINCNNRTTSGENGYCQIHTIEGTAEETTQFD